MALRLQLACAAAVLLLALSGCTVRVGDDPSTDTTIVKRSSSTKSSWSVTQNGCTMTDEAPQKENPQPVAIHETEEVKGPLAKSWTWTVENTTYQSFRVRLHLQGPLETPYYHADQLAYSLTGGCGQRPVNMQNSGTGNVAVSLSTQPAQTIIDYTGQGMMTLGQWTLSLEAREAVMVYDVEIIVEY